MEPNTLDGPKFVEFNGQTYCKDNKTLYYLSARGEGQKRERLHRAVWALHNGPIPEGFHIHHKDHNRLNNFITNLEALTQSEHQSGHMQEPERIAQSRESLAKAIEAAPAWHKSEEGREWHRLHASQPKKQDKPCVCLNCGLDFLSKLSDSKYCTNNCKSASRKRQRK